jgi:hypothetical protein
MDAHEIVDGGELKSMLGPHAKRSLLQSAWPIRRQATPYYSLVFRESYMKVHLVLSAGQPVQFISWIYLGS